MAKILPDTPVFNTSPEAAKIYRLLKRLSDEDYAVWQRLAISIEPSPDFWILRRDRRALLIAVSTLSPSEVKAAVQPNLFRAATATVPTGFDEQNRLSHFAAKIASSDQALALLEQIPGLILFPNIAEDDLAAALPTSFATGISWAGKEALGHDTFDQFIESRLGAPMPKEMINVIRAAFTPEVVIPKSFTVQKPIERNTEAHLTDYLLDYQQEQALKSDLDLSDEARAAANDYGLRLVNGVAGSGKSLILVYRAHLLHQLFPKKRILGLTLNKPLIHDLERRYKHLSQNGSGVKWTNFHRWCRGLLPKSETRLFISIKSRERLIEEVQLGHLGDTNISARMLQGEIDWFKDRLLFGLDDYLSADREKRGFAIRGSELRERVYKAMWEYQKQLKKIGCMDWGDLPREIWRLKQNGKLQLPVYDVVLIDEAQFFAPLWFEIIKQIIKPKVGHLFMAADPTQGFLKRGQSWRASGLEVRGRTIKMAKSYRTTREILNFATLLYRERVADDDEEIVAPDLLNMPNGKLPVIVPVTARQDEVTRIVNEIRELLNSGAKLNDFLIIYAAAQGFNQLLSRLRREFGATAAFDPKVAVQGDYIRVCTLNSVTGLESPIVIIMGADELFEEEHSVRLSEEEKADLISDNTKKLFMAVTRAGQRVVITYVGQLPEFFEKLRELYELK